MTFDAHLAVQILPLLLRGLVVTIEATLAGFVLALAGGLVLALGYRAKSLPPRTVSRGLVEFLRNTPLLVQLYFLFYGLPLLGIRFSAMITGVLGLGIYYSAYIAEVYRGGRGRRAPGTMGSRSGSPLQPRSNMAADHSASGDSARDPGTR